MYGTCPKGRKGKRGYMYNCHAYVFASDQKRKCRVLIVAIDHRFGKVPKATLASKGVYMYDELFVMAAMRQFGMSEFARYLTDMGMLYLNRRVLSRRFQ